MAASNGAQSVSRMETLLAQYSASMSGKEMRVLARKPVFGHPNINLPATLDLELLEKSFCGQYAISKRQIMEWLTSSNVVYCIHEVNKATFSPLRHRLLLHFPRGECTKKHIKNGIDTRIADMAMKISHTGLKPFQVETKEIWGMANFAEKMYNASKDAFFSKQFDIVEKEMLGLLCWNAKSKKRCRASEEVQETQ
ncbi:uncharacterized protein MYCFIDRAFT_194670 [Pseudocercospora fijiensis CIRAD86]|uniref:Uncharacterized protein n=1 Tax=Pseudocercospora fijiensis (strain CIRAD86) TaxID=383855 RepID=M2ZA10_PSEFD|nr:uncharacterized protein MYCFIDRAFT_194670 [Pseudocercospora fijiensis CIRAD86]EME86685.1 hypothetical protein MYCFIDRAFT_194670 [Pseudocercospora fijiensis CIRAD86]